MGDSFFLHKSTFLSVYLPLFVRLFILGLALIMAIILDRAGHVVITSKQKPKGVMTTGVFRYVRHPLYLASILGYFGLAVSTASLFSFMLLIGIFIFHNYIAGYEENLLVIKYGEEYISYKERTGKWIPRIGADR